MDLELCWNQQSDAGLENKQVFEGNPFIGDLLNFDKACSLMDKSCEGKPKMAVISENVARAQSMMAEDPPQTNIAIKRRFENGSTAVFKMSHGELQIKKINDQWVP